MPDVFHWKNDTPDAITLYFYATIMRLSYYPESPLWRILVTEYGGLRGVTSFGPASSISSGWTILYGNTGTIVIFQGSVNFPVQHLLQLHDGIQWNLPLTEDPTYPGRVSLWGKDRVDEIYSPALLDAVAAGSLDSLTTCGHSMGGQIAQLAGVRLKRDTFYDFQGAITMGSTKVGDDVFARDIGFRVVRLENWGDPVPLFPFNFLYQGIRVPDRWQFDNVQEFQHAGVQFHIDIDSHMTINRGPFSAAGLSFDQIGESGPHKQVIKAHAYPPYRPDWQHFGEEYCRRLRNRLFQDSLLTQLKRRERWVLDLINSGINLDEGINWKLDLSTGLPTDWIIDPNLPAPRCGCHH